MKKVTLQEIANSLGISRTTVWKVFSGHEGVSDSLRTKVIAKAQELGYAIPEDFQYPQSAEETTPVNIAVAVCRPETSLFWMTIIHQIAKVFSTHNVNLDYTYLPTLADAGKKVDSSLCLTTPLGIDTYREEIDTFLSSLSRMPDAFVCASDYVACILMQLLEKRGLRVPEDVAVSGFDNNTEDLLAEHLTTVQVFNEELGARLALQILYRIKYPNTPHEITYLGTNVLYRDSTGD